MAGPVQHIVVSNLELRKPKRGRFPLKMVLFFAGLLALCLLLWLFSKAEVFLIGMGVSGVILFIIALLNRDDRQKDSRFICYTDPHQIVHIEYSNPQDDPFKKVVRVQFPAASLLSYTLHTFFGGKPAMMHLQVRGTQREYVLGPVPVEYLNTEQQQQLFNFLDSLTVKTKRLYP